MTGFYKRIGKTVLVLTVVSAFISSYWMRGIVDGNDHVKEGGPTLLKFINEKVHNSEDLLHIDVQHHLEEGHLNRPTDRVQSRSTTESLRQSESIENYIPVDANQTFWLQLCWLSQQSLAYSERFSKITLNHIDHATKLRALCDYLSIIPRTLDAEDSIDSRAFFELKAEMRTSQYQRVSLDVDWPHVSPNELFSIVATTDDIYELGYAIGILIKREIIELPVWLNGFLGPVSYGDMLPRLLWDLAFQIHCERNVYCSTIHPISLMRCLQSTFGCPVPAASFREAVWLTLTPLEYELFEALLSQIRSKM